MPVMHAQEILPFLENQRDRTDVANRPGRVSSWDWKVTLSDEMPQQSASSNDCAMCTSVGCDIMSAGGEVTMIDKEKIEAVGRPRMAHIAKGRSSHPLQTDDID